MTELAALWGRILEVYRALPAGPFGKGWVYALAFFAFFYCFVWAMERAYGTRTDHYRSRSFLHDAAYWFYLRSGLHYFLFMSVAIPALQEPLAFLDVRPFVRLPFIVQVAIYVVLNDFLYYWVHRAEHHFRFLWAFHAVHHSQERLTFVTGARFHPVEELIMSALIYIPLRLAGFDAFVWLPLTLIIMLQAEIEHSQIPWRYGPFYKILVSPIFHSFHHSTDPAYRDMHFGQTLCVWDHLFGTAVKADAPAPKQFGVEGLRPASLYQTLAAPFRLLHEYYGAPPQAQAKT